MQLVHYPLSVSDKVATFEFTSQRPKGCIEKVIQFTIIAQSSTYVIYNLAFGDINVNNGELNDLVVTNNGDTEKILATVAVAVNLFLKQNPSIGIYATGSTAARNRLYCIAISKYFKRLESDFMILGQTEDDDWLTFEKSINYKAFFVFEKRVSLNDERNSKSGEIEVAKGSH